MLRKCSVCEREFAVGLYGEKYTTVCPECRAIDEQRMKKETEQMVDLIVRIENICKEYWHLQEQYRKLTGRQHEWLK